MARVDGQDRRAICVRCGGARADFAAICPQCGHRPDDEGRLVAWLLSSSNLSSEELDAVQKRIISGEAIRPSERMLAKARAALGRDFTSDAGLTTKQRLLLLATSLLVTPLVGWVLFVWWYRVRPRAAIQALALSLPASVLFVILILYLRNA
jgi:hypothetical protein